MVDKKEIERIEEVFNNTEITWKVETYDYDEILEYLKCLFPEYDYIDFAVDDDVDQEIDFDNKISHLLTYKEWFFVHDCFEARAHHCEYESCYTKDIDMNSIYLGTQSHINSDYGYGKIICEDQKDTYLVIRKLFLAKRKTNN